MDEFSSRKTSSGLFFSRKRSTLERGQTTPICSRIGCSSRMSSVQNNRTTVVDKPKPLKRPLYSPSKNGKEATASSSKAPVSPLPRKSSEPIKNGSSVSVPCSRRGKETNVSRESTFSSRTRTSLSKYKKLNDVDPSSASTSGSSSSSTSESVLGRKRMLGLPTRGKKINNDSNHGISITESRRTRNLGSTRNDGVTSVRTARSSSRTPRTESSSITLDTNDSISEYLYPFGNNGNMSRLGRSSTSREDGRRNNLNNIAEMLLAMETIDQDDDLNYEQMVDEETNLFLRGLGLPSHDQHREMRLDIDNMSYEELLELGDRIGTVSTALSEETLTKCLNKTIYQTAIDGLVRTGDDTKCSICQEEYEEGNEVGRLVVCQHLYHAQCIQRWLNLKNWCPICKSSAAAAAAP